MSDFRTVQLTLAFHQSVEPALLAALPPSTAGLQRFSIIPAAGHGPDLEHGSVHERVYGHAKQRLLLALTTSDSAMQLLQLREQLPGVCIDWWLNPVLDGGRLA